VYAQIALSSGARTVADGSQADNRDAAVGQLAIAGIPLFLGDDNAPRFVVSLAVERLRVDMEALAANPDRHFVRIPGEIEDPGRGSRRAAVRADDQPAPFAVTEPAQRGAALLAGFRADSRQGQQAATAQQGAKIKQKEREGIKDMRRFRYPKAAAAARRDL